VVENPIDAEEVGMDKSERPETTAEHQPKHRADVPVDGEEATGIDLAEFGEDPDTELAG
jgi:hypothetical protein